MSTEEGLQVPVIPFEDVVDNGGTDCPAQIVSAVPKLNVVVSIGFTVTFNEVGKAH